MAGLRRRSRLRAAERRLTAAQDLLTEAGVYTMEAREMVDPDMADDLDRLAQAVESALLRIGPLLGATAQRREEAEAQQRIEEDAADLA